MFTWRKDFSKPWCWFIRRKSSSFFNDCRKALSSPTKLLFQSVEKDWIPTQAVSPTGGNYVDCLSNQFLIEERWNTAPVPLTCLFFHLKSSLKSAQSLVMKPSTRRHIEAILCFSAICTHDQMTPNSRFPDNQFFYFKCGHDFASQNEDPHELETFSDNFIHDAAVWVSCCKSAFGFSDWYAVTKVCLFH